MNVYMYCCFQNKRYTAPLWFYVSSELPHPLDAQLARTGRPSIRPGHQQGVGIYC